MIILYGCGSPNVQKILLMLAETGLAYEFRSVSLYDGALHAPDFRAMAPNGKLPLLVDAGMPLWESGAILIHLAEKAGMFLPVEQSARGAVLQWLMWQMAGVGPMFGQALHFRFIAPPGSDYGRDRYLREVNRLYDVAEVRLADSRWLGGADYSIADIAAIPWLRNYIRTFDIDMGIRPHVADWIARIAARPAWVATEAMAKQLYKADIAAQQEASDAQRAAFFGQAADATP